MDEKTKYTALWSRPEGYGNNYDIPKGREVVEFITRHMRVNYERPLSVLDIGGGDGRLKKFFEGHDYTSLDIAPNAGADICEDITRWSDPGAYECAVCFDVMEHLPTELVPAALRNIRDTAEQVGFMISTRPDRFGARIGMTLHLTVKPAAWWVAKIKDYFNTVELLRNNKSDYCIILAENPDVRE